MSEHHELVCRLHAAFSTTAGPRKAARILQKLEDTLLIPAGLYLHGELRVSKDAPDLAPEITGFITRADGKDLTERERLRVESWLASTPQLVEFSVGPLIRADMTSRYAKDALPDN
jgi:uncharacterized protein YggL (DUF469 family)